MKTSSTSYRKKGNSSGSIAVIYAALAAMMPIAVLADDYYLKSADADWSVAESFATSPSLSDTASTPPGANDDVYLLADADISLVSGSASFTTAASVGRIVPQSGSRLLLTVDGDVSFGAKINNGATAAATNPFGEIVKLGDGVLTLTATSTVPSNAALDFTYYTSFVVEKGTLKLPQHGCATHFYYGDVTVSNNAALYMPVSYNISSGAAIPSYMRMRSLCGDGNVTGDSSSNTQNKYVYLEKWEQARKVSVFGGTISGGNVYLYAHASLTVTNNASSFTGLTQVQDGSDTFGDNGSGVITTTSFGNQNQPSPVGKNVGLTIQDYGGGFRYSGNGETSNKLLLLAATSGREGCAFLDAGHHGGVTFTGEFRNNTATEKHLVLTGSNTVACIMANSWMPSTTGGYPIFTTKRGSGTWRFEDVANRAYDNKGGFAIEDGSLQFTSIANKGESCSLGTASYLTRPMTGVPSEADMRAYAYTLGSTNDYENAVLEYVGAECAIATNRATVVVGTGTIRSSATGKGYLSLTDVSPRDAAAVTLMLDGTNTNHNVLRDISDGTGTVSVVKRGSGEWTLSGDTRFSGALRVEEGVLTVVGPRYTWFRLSVMQAGDGAADNTGSTRGQIAIDRISLYDSDGVCQNVGLSYESNVMTNGRHNEDVSWKELVPGSVKLGRPGYTAARSRDIGELFAADGSDPVTVQYYEGDSTTDYVVSSTNDPSSWISYVMRLTNGVPEIAAYDIQGYHNKSIAIRWPKYVRMEGSRDGVIWDWLGDHEFDLTSITAGNPWLSDGSTYTAGQARKGKGVALTHGSAPDAFVMSNVTSVAVSSGAVLRTFDDVTLSSIEVDCDDFGTIQGFTLAESGTINIRNAPSSGQFTLAGFLSGVKGGENLENWTLQYGGIAKDGKKIKVRGEDVMVVGTGLLILFR